MSVRVTRESRAVPVRPGAIYGNRVIPSVVEGSPAGPDAGDPSTALGMTRQITVTYTDAWTLLFESGAAIDTRTFSGAGSVTIEIDPGCAWAIRNDGGADVYVIAPEGKPRVIAEPVKRIAGVDGCRRGWVAVVKDGAAIETRVCTNDAELLALFHECAVVAIDVPIGLAERGPRSCDHHARRFLGHRSSSVFPAPLRALLGLRDYAEANRVSNHLQQRGISKQGFAIVPKVAQIDNLLQRHRELRGRVYEVHPEVSFVHWNRGEPLAPKKSHAGAAARRALASAHFGEIPAVPRGAREDDLLDAFAALWTAERILEGRARTLGDAHADLTGLPMRIVY